MASGESLPHSASLPWIEALHRRWQDDPGAVGDDWRAWFEGLDAGREGGVEQAGDGKRAAGARPGGDGRATAAPSPDGAEAAAPGGRAGATADPVLQERLSLLVRAWRVRGHRVAAVDPLGRPVPRIPELEPGFWGLYPEHADLLFSAASLHGPPLLTLAEVHERLRTTYGRSIGVQYMHIDELDVQRWLQRRMEATQNRLALSRPEQLRILERLTEAVVFEQFVQRKYVGATSFSLEGCESLIPLLDLTLERLAGHGAEEVVLGMAHRGRLAVLANVLGKAPAAIFREFDDSQPERLVGRGDVKYHLGWRSEWRARSGRPLRLALLFNPSHLEYVDPVVLGRVRARQDRLEDAARSRVVALLVHGDASFAGEGVVQETLNLSQLPGYEVGGTIHVVLNNQIGYTTPPEEGRSSVYATDVAKMLQVPIFHVNGEDPEAVAQVVHLATEFRRTFRRDVVVDLHGYRRRGHNEGDDPSFTQPTMYRAIRERPTVREGYLEHLLRLGDVSREDADALADRCKERLEEGLRLAREEPHRSEPVLQEGLPEDGVVPAPGRDGHEHPWAGYRGGPEREVPEVDTGVPRRVLVDLLRRMNTLPEGFRPHKLVERRAGLGLEMAEGARPLPWASAEALALASLAVQGYRVRLSGQDTARGTFSQRHAVLFDAEDGTPYEVFGHLGPGQAPVEVLNSPLSEVGVMGFEYGYSLQGPDALVAWEAQYGDFVNAAQVIVDQFVASSEDKWKLLSGLVLLLPHGYEGRGPEHSSARLERFLQLCAEDNLQVCWPSTPAQYFHLLRRQVVRTWRKPLVVLTPKSLLRRPEVTSELDELASGRFRRVLPDERSDPARTSRVLLCSGKVSWDLFAAREEQGRHDVAIVRVEQLHPWPEEGLLRALAAYAEDIPLLWVQEEPENNGAWPWLCWRLRDGLPDGRWLEVVARAPSASPATGSHGAHDLEQAELLARAFGDGRGARPAHRGGER